MVPSRCWTCTSPSQHAQLSGMVGLGVQHLKGSTLANLDIQPRCRLMSRGFCDYLADLSHEIKSNTGRFCLLPPIYTTSPLLLVGMLNMGGN